VKPQCLETIYVETSVPIHNIGEISVSREIHSETRCLETIYVETSMSRHNIGETSVPGDNTR
jgi:hypothetical protein